MNVISNFVNSLYGNVGSKIKKFAIAVGIISVLGCIISGIVLSIVLEYALFLLLIPLSVVTIIPTWFIYAFGQIAEDVSNLGINYVDDEEDDELPEI